MAYRWSQESIRLKKSPIELERNWRLAKRLVNVEGNKNNHVETYTTFLRLLGYRVKKRELICLDPHTALVNGRKTPLLDVLLDTF